MKRLMFFMFLIIPLALLAQVDTSTVMPNPPGSVIEVIADLDKWFGGLGLLAALTVFVAGLLNGLLKVQKKFVRQLIAWLVGVGLAVIGQVANLGFLAEATWLTTILYGATIGLVSNGLFKVKTGLDLIGTLERLLGNLKKPLGAPGR